MSPAAALSPVLPFWAQWAGPLFLAPTALALSYVVARATLRVAIGRVPDELHWTERARRIHPARVASALLLVSQALGWATMATIYCQWTLHDILTPWSCLFASLAGSLLAARHFASRLGRQRVPLLVWLRALAARLFLFLGALSAFAIALVMVQAQLGAWALLPPLLAFVDVFGGGVILASALRLYRPASPRLQAAMRAASERTGVRFRAAHEIPLTVANALALPLARRVLFTPPALALLDDEELALVCAHELGHVGEQRRISILRSGFLLLLLEVFGLQGLLAPRLGMATLPVVLGIYLLALVGLVRIGRRAEQSADAVAHAAQLEEAAYARALEKLYHANLSPAVLRSPVRVHPHLYDRLLAAGVTPDYPRPSPPGRRRFALALLLGLALAAATLISPSVARRHLPRENETAELISVALLGGEYPEVPDLADAHFRRQEFEQAVAWYRAAALRWRKYPRNSAWLADALAHLGRCDEVKQVLEQARLGEASLSADAANALQWTKWRCP